jgi:hypothetical protein
LHKDKKRRVDIFELENILIYDFHWIPFKFIKLNLIDQTEFYYSKKAFDVWQDRLKKEK